MQANSFIGHHCPICKTSIADIGYFSKNYSCPGCGGQLQAASGGPKMDVVANATCAKCNFQAKGFIAVGCEARCPSCDELF